MFLEGGGFPRLPRLTTAGPADPLEPVVPVPLSAHSVTLRQDVSCGSGAADLVATRAQIRGNVVKPQCRGGWGKIPRVVINGISPPRCWVAGAGSPGLTLPALSGSSVLPQWAGKGEQPLACLSQRGSAVPISLPGALVPAAWNPMILPAWPGDESPALCCLPCSGCCKHGQGGLGGAPTDPLGRVGRPQHPSRSQ